MSWIAIEQVGIGIFSFQSQGLLIWDQFRLNSPFFLSSFHSVELFISFYIYVSPVLIFVFFFTTVITFYVLVSFLSAFLYCRLLFRLRWLSMTDSLLAASPRHFNIFLCLLLWFFLSFSILLCGHRLFLPIFLWRRGWGGQGGRRGFPVRLAGVTPPPPSHPTPFILKWEMPTLVDFAVVMERLINLILSGYLWESESISLCWKCWWPLKGGVIWAGGSRSTKKIPIFIIYDSRIYHLIMFMLLESYVTRWWMNTKHP